MKNKWMTLMGILVVGLLALFFFTRERSFKWDTETQFLPDDDEPFGAELFDKMAAATLPNGYQYFDGDLEELLDGDERCALLLLYTNLRDVNYFYEALEDFVEKGNKVMLVTDELYYAADGTCFESYISHNYFSIKDLRSVLTKESQPAEVMIEEEGAESLQIPGVLLSKVSDYDNDATVTSSKNAYNYSYYDYGTYSLSFEMKAGKGTAYVVAAPLLYTNYGVLDKNISRYLEYQMGQLADLPVVRVSYRSMAQYNYAHGASRSGNDYDSRESSPLSYLLQYPPLRWGLYTMLAAALIFMFFSARHRQRVIPVVAKPVNRNMEFVKLLGTIYYRRHDNHDLFLKKYTYFKEELRRKQMIDLEDERMKEDNARMLALRTKTEEADMANTLKLLKAMEQADELYNEQLQKGIQKIDDILRKL